MSDITSILANGETKYFKDIWAREQIESRAGHEIIDMDGSELPSRRNIQFMDSDITDDESNNVTEVAFNINRYVSKPKVTIGEYIYNGEEQGPVIEDLTDDVLVANAKATNAGTYTLTLSLKDIRYTSWMDGSTSDITYEYSINKLKLEFPHITHLDFDYDRNPHAPTIDEYDANYIMITGNTEPLIEPGDYKIYIDLKDKNNTCWYDETTTMIIQNWRIDKADTIITVETAITLNASKLYQDITVHYNDEDIEEREISIDIDSLAEDIFTVEHLTGSTYRVSSISPGTGGFTVYVFLNEHYRSNGKYINVTVESIPELNDCSWEFISKVSASGNASSCWNIGDTKEIVLNGQIGDYLTLSNYRTRVYILGFDHNSDLEGTGISFGCFQTEDDSTVALVDTTYGTQNSDGLKNFTINHWKDSSADTILSYGGWKACDLRYDILGSTDVPPSNYGASKNTSSIGYDPSENCKINPVSNTLMAAFPFDLRSVMKPICKYSDNGYEYGNVLFTELLEAITSSYDYLPLMSEYELSGEYFAGNMYEYQKQAQYDYYKNGNDKFKYNHIDLSDGSVCTYFNRSRQPAADRNYDQRYWTCYSQFSMNGTSMSYSYGLAPVFLV